MSSLKKYILFIPELVEGRIKFAPLVSDTSSRFEHSIGTFVFDTVHNVWHVLEPLENLPKKTLFSSGTKELFWKRVQDPFLHLGIPEEVLNSKDALLLLLAQ